MEAKPKEDEVELIRAQLLAYCEGDTLAMVMISKKLAE